MHKNHCSILERLVAKRCSRRKLHNAEQEAIMREATGVASCRSYMCDLAVTAVASGLALDAYFDQTAA